MTWYLGAMFDNGNEADDAIPPHFSNGLCPRCGCEMEREEYTEVIPAGDWFDGVTEITETCPCCWYSQVSYDA